MNQENINRVFDEALRVAAHFLGKSGEFYPFAVALTASDELRHVQGWTGEEMPPSKEVIEQLQRGLSQGASAEEFLTTALISDVRIRRTPESEPSDAISFRIEDREGAIVCYVPYDAAAKKIDCESMTTLKVESSVFSK